MTSDGNPPGWSFDRIYDDYKTAIYTFALYLVGDREQADELTCATFVWAFCALPTMDAHLQVEAWLYRMATGIALRRRTVRTWFPRHIPGRAPADAQSAVQAESYDTTERVRVALGRMPQQERAALLLSTQARFSYSEIALALALDEADVKVCLSRARQSFRTHYMALAQGGNTPCQ
jgi:RNA polymerase sigma-70 factor, ECF subfamily